jgi:hypothetical protein
MDVQTYHSCLHELNHQVDWLPSTDLPLTEDQLHQAFFDGMPTIWKEQYDNASRSVHNTLHTDLLRFFHMQQKADDCIQQGNELKQQQDIRTCSFCNSDCAVTRFLKKTKHYKSEIKDNAKQ